MKKVLSILLAVVILLSAITVAIPVTSSAKEITCPKCYGLKRVSCTICGGLGYQYMMTIKGYEWRLCVRCHGRGEDPCPECGGWGTIYVKDPISASPAKTSITKLTAKELGFTVSWKKKDKNTTGYQVQYSTNSKFKKAKRVTINNKLQSSFTASKLVGGKKYFVRVRVYGKGDNKTYYSAWSASKAVVVKKVAKPPKTAISKIVSKSAAFAVSWKKQTKNTTGYQIQYATNSKFKSGKKKAVTGKTSLTISKLTGGKKYYVRVRTYRKYGGKYYFSAWSGAKSVVTKYAAKAPKATVITSVTREEYYGDRSPAVTIYFRKVTGCTGYQLQTSTYSNFKTDRNTKTYTCSHNNNYGTYYSNKQWCWWFTYSDYGEISNELDYNPLKCDTTYYFRIRTYKKANGKTYYSKWSKTLSGYWEKPNW